MSNYANLPTDWNLIYNPSFDELDKMIEQMPNAKKTKYGSWNVSTKVVSRSGPSTFMVSDNPEKHTIQCITKAEGDKMATMQNEYMSGKDMIVIDGYIGNDPEYRVKARLIVEPSSANIAAMQKTMYYPLESYENEGYEPELTIVYTPDLEAPGYADDRLIASEVPDLDDVEIFQPRKLYERAGRLDEYNSMVAKLKAERLEYFKKYPKLNASITEVFG